MVLCWWDWWEVGERERERERKRERDIETERLRDRETKREIVPEWFSWLEERGWDLVNKWSLRFRYKLLKSAQNHQESLCQEQSHLLIIVPARENLLRTEHSDVHRRGVTEGFLRAMIINWVIFSGWAYDYKLGDLFWVSFWKWAMNRACSLLIGFGAQSAFSVSFSIWILKLLWSFLSR